MTPMLIGANLDKKQTIAVEELAKTILWIYQQPQTICIRDLAFAPTYYEGQRGLKERWLLSQTL